MRHHDLLPHPQLENALLAGDPDSPGVQLKLCDFGYSKDELVRSFPLCAVLCVLGFCLQ